LKSAPTLLADNEAVVLTDSASLDIPAIAQGYQVPCRDGAVKNSFISEVFEGLEQNFREIFGHD